jgi:hypothetical protein
VNAIRELHEKKVQELMEKVRAGTIERPEFREQMEKLQDGLMQELKEVLTKEQLKKFEELMPRSREPRR